MADTAVKIPFSEAAAPSTPAASKVVIYAKSDGLMYSKDDAGVETLMSGGVGGGNYTGSPWSVGTSMPGGPATNQRVTRTDLGMDFYYDGTRWVTVQLFTIQMLQIRTIPTAYSATTSGVREAVVPGLQGGSDIWLVNVRHSFHIAGGSALSGSHKWVGTVTKLDTNLGETTLATMTIDSGSSSVYRAATVNIGALLGTTSFVFWENWTKTGTPGNLTNHVQLAYRIVAT